MSDPIAVSPEDMARVEALAREVGAVFDRENLAPELATAVLLDFWARVTAKVAAGSEEARKHLVAAGAALLDELTDYYARGGQ